MGLSITNMPNEEVYRIPVITRISNTASQREIELATQTNFLYGHLYRPQMIINGKMESSLSIITSEAPHIISIGIWGILPTNYAGDWKEFQNVQNSLTTDIATVDETHWLHNSFKHRRCVILATGFYNFIVRDKNLHPVYVTHPTKKIIRLAGVYNITEDGFKTCSILVKRSNNFHLKTTFVPYSPILFSPQEQEDWLSDGRSVGNKIEGLMKLTPVVFNQEVGGTGKGLEVGSRKSEVGN